MKKNFEKMISISLTIMASIFVIFLLLIIFNSDIAAEANNGVVHALFGVFSVILLALCAIDIRSAFTTNERVNQILLFKTQDTSKKASVKVIRKLAREAVAQINGVKVGGIQLFVDDTNDVVLRATVKILGNHESAKAVMEQMSDILRDEFNKVLGFSFKEIELKLVSFKEIKAPAEAPIAPTEPKNEQKDERKIEPTAEPVEATEVVEPKQQKKNDEPNQSVETASSPTPEAQVYGTPEAQTFGAPEAAPAQPAVDQYGYPQYGQQQYPQNPYGGQPQGGYSPYGQ
jgi:hypothetical protein